MKNAKDLIPWQVTELPIRPFSGFWSFNPSICYDGEIWRLVLRSCDYAMPNGVTIRSKGSGQTGQQTKNAMLILDPQTWKPIQIFKMQELDGLPRASTPHVGYEDMRIFRTDKGGLQGIAASLHLERGKRSLDGRPQHQPPEQVLLSFDDEYNITHAHPIRGGGWASSQKNWVPFDDVAEPRFIYSIDKGTMFDADGPVHGDEARVRPSTRARPVALASEVPAALASEVPAAPVPREETAPQRDVNVAAKQSDRKSRDGADVRIMRGGRMKLDAGSASVRPSVRSSAGVTASARRPAMARSDDSRRRPAMARSDDSRRMMGAGQAFMPKYDGLRGGTQLVRVGDDAWLALGHEMRYEHGLKFYFHTWYLSNAHGKLMSASPQMKLVTNGIEFAAGLGIDGDKVVVSFGVDDYEAKLGITSLSAVMEILVKVH